MAETITWVMEPIPHVRLLDQTKLPSNEEYIEAKSVSTLIEAIQALAVRGAPALGAAGGFGVVLAALESAHSENPDQEFERLTSLLREARPTAVNLAWGVDRVKALKVEGPERMLAEAQAIAAEDAVNNKKLSEYGADWIERHIPCERYRILTHCNTGELATAGWGTALGVIRELAQRDKVEFVYADETRPLLQGARLTSWELKRLGIDHAVQVDGAAAATILRGLVDFAVIGADRITRNGDTANKIGSASVAIACKEMGIPFMVAAPLSTIDLTLDGGWEIEIEQRAGSEVSEFNGKLTTPMGVEIHNPAFDVTPHHYVSAIATEAGVIEPNVQSVAAVVRNFQEGNENA